MRRGDKILVEDSEGKPKEAIYWGRDRYSVIVKVKGSEGKFNKYWYINEMRVIKNGKI